MSSPSDSSPPSSIPSESSTPPPDASSSPPAPPSGGSSSPPPPPSVDSTSPPPPSDASSSPPAPPSGGSSSPPPPPSVDSTSPPPPSDASSSPAPESSASEPSKEAESPEKSKGKGNISGGGESSPSRGRSRSKSDDSFPPPPRMSRSGMSSGTMELPHQSEEDSSKAIVAGVAAGAAVILILMIIVCICCCRKNRRRPPNNTNYFREASRTSSDYYNNTWHDRPSVDGMKFPQPGHATSEPGWYMAPPPVTVMSDEMNSSGFSGSHGAGPMASPHPGMAMGYNQSSFTYNDLALATNGFSQANMLGQGGFGYVHKGVLSSGKEVAVKSLKANSGQGEREFQAEVEIISRVHHRHLVSLVGYCIAGSQRMLVYEFVDNGTLEYHLHGSGRPTMDWPTRLKIALGSAKGFAYLHEDCNSRIIHRDIKTANILLDNQFEAKVADFGLAKLSSDTNTHVSTRIMGTFGYLAPEYASSGKLTDKSDVYSFGIVLLELISGRRPIDITRDDDDDTLIDWARPILMNVSEGGGGFEELVDPKLGDNYDPHEMVRMIHCAAACVRQSARRRPKMSKLVRVLEGDVALDDLNDGSKPGQSALIGPSSDIKRFRNELGISSQEFSSEEHSNTNEFRNV